MLFWWVADDECMLIVRVARVIAWFFGVAELLDEVVLMV